MDRTESGLNWQRNLPPPDTQKLVLDESTRNDQAIEVRMGTGAEDGTFSTLLPLLGREAELRMLHGFRQELGIEVSEAVQLELDAASPSMQIGKEGAEKSALLDCMIEMALADGVLDPREEALVMKVGVAVGVQHAELVRRLELEHAKSPLAGAGADD